MLPSSSRPSETPYGMAPAYQAAPSAPGDSFQRNSHQAPLFDSMPIYTSSYLQDDFKAFFETGAVPVTKSSQSCIAYWCLANNAPQALVTLLKNGDIKDLCLSSRFLDVEHARVLASVLKADKALLEISVSANKMGSEGIEVICAALEENSTLLSLDLSRNSIDSEAAAAIGNMLEKNRTIQVLTLQSCNIDKAQLQIIANSLRKNVSVTELNLASNAIGAEGIATVAEMLEKCPYIESLDLSCNGLDATAGPLIGAMLKTNTTLKQLFLGHNNLESDGAKPILDALKVNTTLKELALPETNLDERCASDIGLLLQKNRSLCTLDFNRNQIFIPIQSIHSVAMECIVQGLEHNTVITVLGLNVNHPIHYSDAANASLVGTWYEEVEFGADMARVDNLMERNRTFDALATKNTPIWTMLPPGQALSMDEARLMTNAIIMTAASPAAFESTMVQIQCAINVLASET